MVEADIFSEDNLKLHFKGQDAVLSCLGFPISFFYGVTGYTQSMKAVLNAMREVKVNRIITMTSWYTDRKCCAVIMYIQNRKLFTSQYFWSDQLSVVVIGLL